MDINPNLAKKVVGGLAYECGVGFFYHIIKIHIEKIAELKYHIDNIKFLKFLKRNALFKIPYYPIFQIQIQYLEYHIS